MAFTDDLENARHATDFDVGVMWAVGWDSDAYWVKKSYDDGETAAVFADGTTTRKQVCTAGEVGGAAIELTADGNLIVTVPATDGADLYISEDNGETWKELT